MYTGCCAVIERIAQIRQAGFDAVELAATELIERSEGEIADLRQQLRDLHLPVCAVNMYCGKDLFDVNLPLDEAKIRDHAAAVSARTAALGAATFGFGAPHCRSRREETPQELAMERLLRFLELSAAEAGKAGVCMLLEPVNRLLCNLVNTVTEAGQILDAVHSDHLRLLVDFCHAKVMGETPLSIQAVLPMTRHVHVGHQKPDGPGRDFLGDRDREELQQIIALLRRGGYDGAISMEAGGPGDYLEGIRTSNDVLQQSIRTAADQPC